MDPVRVLLADDQALFLEGLALLLDARADIEVVGTASNGEEAVERCTRLDPDVVLMDLRMPVRDGVSATKSIRATGAKARVIALTTFDDDESIFEALRAGAVGYLLKDVGSERLVEAIHAAHRGASFLEPAVAARVVSEFARLSSAVPRSSPLAEPLSDRETDVLRRVARGASNKEIAAELGIAEGTVKNHMSNILAKLGVDDRTRAALRARELGLV